MSPRAIAFAVLASCLVLTACGKPTEPSGTSVVFTGVLDVGGTVQHDFMVVRDGLIEITLTSLTPQSTAPVNMGLGEPTDTGCTLDVAGNKTAGASAQIRGNASAGAWCVALSDAGSLTGPNSYSLTVVHP
jgi:hypothetical protein